MGNGHQPGEVHALSRVCRRLQDRALPALSTSRGSSSSPTRWTRAALWTSRRTRCAATSAPTPRACTPAPPRRRTSARTASSSSTQQVHRLPLLRHRLPLPEPHLLLQGQGPGVLPRVRARPASRRWARSSTRTSAGTTEKCNFCVERDRRRHVARPDARHRPRRHTGLRQHLPGPGAHLRRPRRPRQQTSTSCSASTTASSSAPNTALTRLSATSTTGSAATTTGPRARRRRAATCSTSAPWTATPTGASSVTTRTTGR